MLPGFSRSHELDRGTVRRQWQDRCGHRWITRHRIHDRSRVCRRRSDGRHFGPKSRSLSEFGTCISHPADLSTDEGVESLAAKVAEISPTLDVLVNNAGATWGAPVDDFPAAGFDKIFDINVKAIFLLAQKLLPQLRSAATAEDPARVINIGSIDGLVVSGSENFSYGASKAAVHMLTRKLAATLAGNRSRSMPLRRARSRRR